jgi:hypothetical protein
MRRSSKSPEECRYQTAGLSIDLQLKSCLQNYCASRFLASGALHTNLYEFAPLPTLGSFATFCKQLLRNA